MGAWEDNEIQFPRLIAEIIAAQDIDLKSIAVSMDLSVEEVSSLLARAESVWHNIKREEVGLTLDKFGEVTETLCVQCIDCFGFFPWSMLHRHNCSTGTIAGKGARDPATCSCPDHSHCSKCSP
jgi:hypothetical protein